MRTIPTMAKIAALLMAAGSSRRMGGPNKLLMAYHAKPLITFAVDAVMGAGFSKRILVTGRDQQEIQKHAAGFEVTHNPRFAEGFGTSLAAGFSALQIMPEIDGALVMLADMPLITLAHLNEMIAAFDDKSIVRAMHQGQPGNPVIIPKALFVEMTKLNGEQSGQMILKASGLTTLLVETGPAALADADTPEAFAALQEVDL